MSNQPNEFTIGVDIGGTFTDIVAVNQKNGIQFNEKVLTTPKDPSKAVLTGVKSIIEKIYFITYCTLAAARILH